MLPEWKSVPSPRFWNRCGRSVNGARADPLARPRRPSGCIAATALRPDERGHRVAADPAARRPSPRARASSGCAGTRSRSRGAARRRSRRARLRRGRLGSERALIALAAAAPARRSARRRAGRRGRRDPVGRELAVGGDEHARPCSSRLPTTRGRTSRSYSASRTCSSTNERFSSTTTISSRPSANARTTSGSSGQIMPSAQQPDAEVRERRFSPTSLASPTRPSSRRAETTSWYVLPAATMPDAGPVAAGRGHLVERVGARVRPGRFDAPGDEVALVAEVPRGEREAALRVVPRPPVDLDRGQHGDDPVGSDLRGAEAVGDVRDQLHRHPEPRVAGTARSRAGRGRRSPAGSPGTARASARPTARARSRTGSSTTSRSGRRRRGRARRRSARRPSGSRGGRRRRSGRRPGPCRTRRPRRRRAPRASPRPSCWLPHTAVAASSSLTPGTRWMSCSAISARSRPTTRSRPRERRSRVAGDERPGPQAGAGVGAVPVEEDADQGLHPAEQDAAALDPVAVVEVELVGGNARRDAQQPDPPTVRSGTRWTHGRLPSYPPVAA